MKDLHKTTGRRFSLLELVVVVMILASLAGLVISKVDWARRSADTATAASGMAQVQQNLQLYRTAKGVYPDRFDSLIDASTLATTPAIYDELFIGHGLTTSTLRPATFAAAPPGPPTGFVFSLQHVGMATVVDHDPAATFPGDSATSIRAASAFGFNVSTVLAAVNPASTLARSIYPASTPATADPTAHTILPNGVTGEEPVTLVALGVGPNCSAIGSTMSSAPMCSAVDPTGNYPRYVAIFACFASGKRAELEGVIDSTGQVVTGQLKNFYQNEP